MSYANGTTHYNLPQTVGTDKRDWFDTNQAFSDIDAAIYGAVQSASESASAITALTTRVGTNETNIADLQSSRTTDEGRISALETLTTQHTTDIAGVKTDLMDMIESTQELSATAAYAHAVGEYFIYNDTLYVTTQTINIGDTIVPNTNCDTRDVGTVLTQLAQGGGVAASAVSYDNTTSGLTADDVQEAIDELASASEVKHTDVSVSGTVPQAGSGGLEVDLSSINGIPIGCVLMQDTTGASSVLLRVMYSTNNSKYKLVVSQLTSSAFTWSSVSVRIYYI